MNQKTYKIKTSTFSQYLTNNNHYKMKGFTLCLTALLIASCLASPQFKPKPKPTKCAIKDGDTLYFQDMHDGDQKQVTLKDGKITITPHGNDQTWTTTSDFDETKCSVLVDFNVPNKPNPPPIKLTATFWNLGNLGTRKASMIFTDLTGKLADATTPLNAWVQIEQKDDFNLMCAVDIGKAAENLAKAGIEIAKAVKDCASSASECTTDIGTTGSLLSSASQSVEAALKDCGNISSACANDISAAAGSLSSSVTTIGAAETDCQSDLTKCVSDVKTAVTQIATAATDIASAVKDCA